MERLKAGDVVIYCDSQSRDHQALVTAVWGTDATPAINVAFVSPDENRKDSWGRQIERDSSVVHGSNQGVHGRYWRRAEEERNPFQPATA